MWVEWLREGLWYTEPSQCPRYHAISWIEAYSWRYVQIVPFVSIWRNCDFFKWSLFFHAPRTCHSLWCFYDVDINVVLFQHSLKVHYPWRYAEGFSLALKLDLTRIGDNLIESGASMGLPNWREFLCNLRRTNPLCGRIQGDPKRMESS